jgi:hypothetical protein
VACGHGRTDGGPVLELPVGGAAMRRCRPAHPLVHGGRPDHRDVPVVPLLGNVGVGVGALSYAGQFNLAIVADRDACPDIDVAVAGTRRSLTTMIAAMAAS